MRTLHWHRVLTIAAALGAAAVAAAQTAGAQGAAPPACVPAGKTIVASSGPLAVYTQGARLIACRDGSPVRRWTLGASTECLAPDECELTRVVGVNGSCVALKVYTTDRYHNDRWYLAVADVRRHRSWQYGLRITPAAGGSVDVDAPAPLPSLTLGPGCAVAYINTLGAGLAAEVRTSDASGRFLQARGTDIDPTSLARSGSTITWTQGGQTRSAKLSGAPRRPST